MNRSFYKLKIVIRVLIISDELMEWLKYTKTDDILQNRKLRQNKHAWGLGGEFYNTPNKSVHIEVR